MRGVSTPARNPHGSDQVVGTLPVAITPPGSPPPKPARKGGPRGPAFREVFAHQFLIDRQALAAYRRALALTGEPGKGTRQAANQMLKQPDVQAIIAAGTQELAEATQMDAQWVLQQLRRNYERAMQTEPVLDREGNETGIYTYEGSVANKALELIGKHLGMFGADPADQAREIKILVVNEVYTR